MSKIRSIITLGICIVLFATLLFSNIILAQDGGSYDPWIDTNDDGIIDAIDLQALASIYGASGTPINKTELLLELETRLNSLNASLLTDYYNITECDVIFVDASGDIITGYLNVDSGTLYVDDVNNRVGIGTTSPNGLLQVKGSGATTDWITIEGSYSGSLPTIRSGEDFYIRAGDAGYTQAFRGSELRTGTLYLGYNAVASITTGNFNEDLTIDPNGAGDIILQGNVGIGTTSPATLLDVAGNTTIGGTLNASSIAIPTTTRYYSIPAIAWLPFRPDRDFRREIRDVHPYNTYDDFTWYTAVNLPHGAVVTEFEVFVWDNDLTDISVYLYRQATSSLNGMANVESVGASPSFQLLSDSSISYATIDNQNWAYLIRANTRVGNNSHRLSNVRITYTIEEPLP